MKRLKYLLIAGVSLLLTSCENFLDRQPESSLSGETFWTSEQDLKTWNAGMYDGLQSTLRTNWFYWGELRSGVYAERGTAYDRNLLYNGLNSQSALPVGVIFIKQFIVRMRLLSIFPPAL